MAHYMDVWKFRRPALEAIFGRAEPNIHVAVPPIYDGGGADVLAFRGFVPGVTYVTSGLTGPVENIIQKPSQSLGNYELMICLPGGGAWAANLISFLARYTLQAELNPGETMDLPHAEVPALKGTSISALLFAEPDLKGKPAFKFAGKQFGLLLCVGITARELKAVKKDGSAIVLRGLQRKGVFPYTDPMRVSLSKPDLEDILCKFCGSATRGELICPVCNRGIDEVLEDDPLITPLERSVPRSMLRRR
jgi:hypothetical protein